MPDRRKKVLNRSEAATREILGAAAEKNGAAVHAKMRIADALDVGRSELGHDLYGYALRAHFDFVVTNAQHQALFAVEYDGPHHETDARARANDAKKNTICDRLGMPLARVRAEHAFQKARGIDYVTWLTEIFFANELIEAAYASGAVPADACLDPMMFFSSPNVPGRLPLWLSVVARTQLRTLARAGHVDGAVPFSMATTDSTGETACIAIVKTARDGWLVSESSIYLHGFGLSPSEAADEIAIVSLSDLAKAYTTARLETCSASDVRRLLLRQLHTHPQLGTMYGNVDAGFSFSYGSGAGAASIWRVGALDDEPEVTIDGGVYYGKRE